MLAPLPLALPLPLPLLLLLLTLAPDQATPEVVPESGYTVSTVLDCNKPLRGLPTAALHPFALLPRPRSRDLLLLDHSNSAFYSLPVPVSPEGDIGLFSGKGAAGFSDGGPSSAMFEHPRSFTIDDGDNVYVADRSNRAIRKINKSGVTTTIAGGYSEKTGHVDGPAQNASFSNDFDLVYVPKICSLLISDRGNRLIRQMHLKPEDCAHESKSGLGVAPISIIAVLCVLFGSVLGFVARPYFGSSGASTNHCISKTWKHYRANPGRLVLMSYSDIRSAVADSAPFMLTVKLVRLSLCYLSVVYRNIWLQKQVQCSEPVSLLDSDVTGGNHVMAMSHVFADQLRDLISFDEDTGVSEASALVLDHENEVQCGTEDSTGSKIDDMARAYLLDFADRGQQAGEVDDSGVCGFGLSKRRPRGADRL